jgi:hypothetical protein
MSFDRTLKVAGCGVDMWTCEGGTMGCDTVSG